MISATTVGGEALLRIKTDDGRLLPPSDFLAVAESTGPAVAGRWTHLTGVFDDSTKQVKLYVDGSSYANYDLAQTEAKLGACTGVRETMVIAREELGKWR